MNGGVVEPFVLADTTIPPGASARISIPVSHQLGGFSADLALMVLHGARPGPTVFVSGAIHGDEINGTAVVRRLAEKLRPEALAGTLILAPAVNIYGFLSHDRYLPDRRDLNRSFPGSRKGSLAAQLANCFLDYVIERCSFGIDIHTAAIHRYNLPQIRIAAGDANLIELAMAFGAPVIVESPLRDGSMRQLAAEKGVPMLLLEAGEALRFDQLSIDVGVSGVQRVLAHLGMLDADDGLASVGIPARANNAIWVRAPRGGITRRCRKSGDVVHQGDVLAIVTGLFGEDAEEIVAPLDGIIIGHATLPIVNQGDALFHIAQVANLDHAGEAIETITEAIRASEPDGPATPLLDEDEVI